MGCAVSRSSLLREASAGLSAQLAWSFCGTVARVAQHSAASSRAAVDERELTLSLVSF